MLGSFYLTLMFLTILLITCGLFGLLLKALFKKLSFNTLFLSTLAVVSLIAIFYLHKPTYEIKIPEGYTGEVNLVLSNVKENRLSVDSNGIGYINQRTFTNTFHPIILQDGKDITDRTVGFNPSTFWGVTKTTFNGKVIKSLNFEIVPDNKKGEKQYYNTDLSKFVDTSIVLIFSPE